MKTAKILTILILALGLMVWLPSVSQAVGTVFTYQGRLIDANSTADGLYDFQFKLFDDPNIIIGNQIGNDVNVPNVDVIDGYFTVELDFGVGIFIGDARWLEIGVRDYDPCDVNAFTTLSPRQELTPTPYAIYAKSDGDWMLSGNNMYSIPSGNVGIGTTSPGAKLEVSGGNVLISKDAAAIASVKIPEGGLAVGTTYNAFPGNIHIGASPGVNNYLANTNCIARYNNVLQFIPPNSSTGALNLDDNGNVGIGTTGPGAELEVNGQVKITGGSPAAGKVLTSDSTGLATWQTPAAGGDITAVYADNGLTGGATSGDAHLNVGAGTGISVSADQVSLNTSYTDGRYVNEGQSNSVNSAMIVNDSITASDIATNGVGAAEIAADAVGSSEIASASVTSSKMADGAALGEILDDDGSGSGLDADLLDGQHGSYYRNATNINSGTLSNARFSAYSDLSAEGKIGTGSTQVAAGNHGHTRLPSFFNIFNTSATIVNTGQIDLYWNNSTKRIEVRRDAGADWSYMFISGNMNGTYFRTVTNSTPYNCPVMSANGDMLELHVGQPINNSGMWCDMWIVYTNMRLSGHYILTPGD